MPGDRPDLSTIAALAVKLPQFWTSMPNAWFENVEAQFSTRSITTELTKYEYVIQSLSCDVMQEVCGVLGKCRDSQTPYTVLKEALLKRYTVSESRRIEKLLTGVEMGDRRPS